MSVFIQYSTRGFSEQTVCRKHNFSEYDIYGVLIGVSLRWNTGEIIHPLNSLHQIQTFNLNSILETSSQSQFEFILEVVVDYFDKLHDGKQDFPLVPTEKRMDYKGLGERLKTLEQIQEKCQSSLGKKMIQSPANTKNYTLRYINFIRQSGIRSDKGSPIAQI